MIVLDIEFTAAIFTLLNNSVLEHGKTSSDRELVAEILGLSALSVGASKAVLGGLAVLGCDL